MAVVDSHDTHDEHHDDHHDHGEFIAHHFDSPEQQFDSGKLGIWLFLVTEILFFSGLFVAYTLWRNHHPEIFEQAHVHLDKILGGLNTVVLLFSSLTMALAVRAAQLGKNKNCSVYLLITMVCASMFLGVKAVEYSHKWDMGIFVRSAFDFHSHQAPSGDIGKALGISDYLVTLSIIPTILLVGFLVLSAVGMLTAKPNISKFMLGMAIMVGGYFLGAVSGQLYQWTKDGGGHGAHASATMNLHAMSAIQEVDSEKHDGHDKTAEHGHEHAPGETHDEHAGAGHDGDHSHSGNDHGTDPSKLDRDIGVFFSIYYCMTGLHAIHIIAGIIALAWLYWRSLLGHWRSDYFGPVDYVGLYWHLVDLIWIYLFPLLYLID